MKISVDAEELQDAGVVDEAAEKYCGEYDVSKEDLVFQLKNVPELSLLITEDDAIRWGLMHRPTELF